MCLIAYKTANSELPKDEHLRAASIKNQDGIGVAFWKRGSAEVNIKKDFKDVEDLIKWLHDNIKEEDVCVIHFRLATHGLVDEGNRHPFPITKNKELLRKTELICQMAVAHNGVISEYQHKKFSDTQKFILDILADESIKNNLENSAIQKLVSNFIGTDRLIVVFNNGTTLRWGEWVTEGKILYSNSGYKVYNAISHLNRGNNTNFSKKISQEIFIDCCETCGQYKEVKEIKYKEIIICLCKECRKEHSRGKLNLKDFYEMRMEEEKEMEVTEIQCESCYNWGNITEFKEYYGTKLCNHCFEDILPIIQKGMKSKELI